MDLGTLVREIWRRRLVRAGTAYLVAAFAALQGIDIIVDVLELPGWILRLAVGLAVAGFPAALVVSWMFDLTPGGMVRTAPVSGTARLAQRISRDVAPPAPARPARFPAWLRTTVGLGVGALALAAAGWWALRPAPARQIDSVAVLPLVNHGSADQQYLVDGMHDALIGELAQIPGLGVISRTSVMRYRASPRTAAEIAAELRVDALIEGSVLTADDSVRISVQLVRGATGESLWAGSYTGPLRETLALQRRVAHAIAEEMRLKLSSAQRDALARRSPIDEMAQEAYVRGRAHWRARSAEGLALAVRYLEDAVRTEPGFALAHAALADAYVVARGYGAIDLPWNEAYARARRAAERAIALEPTLGEAHAALAFVHYQADWDVVAAERGLRKAIELNPSNAQAHALLATVLKSRGRADEAVEHARRARDLDPFSPVINRYFAFTLAKTGACQAARPSIRTAVELDPTHPDGYVLLWTCNFLLGNPEEAVDAGARAYQAWGAPPEVVEGYREAFARGGWRAALEYETRALQDARLSVRSAFMLAQRFALLGRTEEAFAALERAYAARDPLLLFELRVDPLLDSIRTDPRYAELLERVGVAG